MRRTIVLLGAALAALVAVFPGGRAQTGGAQLRLVDTDPVTVRATRFKPQEHVRLTIIARGQRVRRATSDRSGAFTIRFPGVDFNNCTGFSVSARGDLGSRASYKRAPGVCPAEPPSG